MNEAPTYDADVLAIERIAAVPIILDVVCQLTGLGFAAIARVTDTRWVACSVVDKINFGLKAGGELKLETTICNEIREARKAVVIDHVATDEVFKAHPTPALYGFQSYISVPIILPNGDLFGTLCAIDPKPAMLSRPEISNTFRMFADLIAFHLDANKRVNSSEAELRLARETATLREQFIAVLGHDLRNPLASIDACASVLSRDPPAEKKAAAIVGIRKSVSRMAELIENVLDFARGRLGSGIALNVRLDAITPTLEHVIAEIRQANPDRVVEADFHVDRLIKCDKSRIGQLLSNLMGNAIAHGSSSPILVEARLLDSYFELSVSNSGEEIPSEIRTRLFEPFFRSSIPGKKQGLGLGLYIASEIAQAHDGRLSFISTEQLTRFTFRMPA